MEYKIAVKSDIGIKKETNQDSCCVKEALTDSGRVLLVVMCDGMGGLAKGEVASASLINSFSEWFEQELPIVLSHDNVMQDVRYQWDRIIKEQNQNIAEYGKLHNIQLGTTVTSILILQDGNYIIAHVGDSRAYRITDESIEILTNDQTFVAREIKMGRMTAEQAASDPRRNVLLQCVGASRIVEPEFFYGKAKANECYMLCSDGFRHVVEIEEIHSSFSPNNNSDEKTMAKNVEELIELNKFRHETDNITAILVRTI